MDPASMDPAAVRAYLTATALLALKMLLMVPLVARQRFAKGVFLSPEDTHLHPKGKVKYDDPDVERPRRAHLNDLENIPIFLAVCLAYMATSPPTWIPVTACYIFTAARTAHTFCYLFLKNNLARGVSFFVGYFTTVFLAASLLLHFF